MAPLTKPAFFIFPLPTPPAAHHGSIWIYSEPACIRLQLSGKPNNHKCTRWAAEKQWITLQQERSRWGGAVCRAATGWGCRLRHTHYWYKCPVFLTIFECVCVKTKCSTKKISYYVPVKRCWHLDIHHLLLLLVLLSPRLPPQILLLPLTLH